MEMSNQDRVRRPNPVGQSIPKVKVEYKKRVICSWPTDTYDIDIYVRKKKLTPHTIFMFIPGNPGCGLWYVKMLKTTVERMGFGFAARVCSYAGHGVDRDVVQTNNGRYRHISWTITGQTYHKMCWVDEILEEEIQRSQQQKQSCHPNLIFVSHSIGSYLVQRLCMIRHDLLVHTAGIIHLMPFFRFDPIHRWKKVYLSTVARSPNLAIRFLQHFARVAASLPTAIVDLYLDKIAGVSLIEDRELARGLVRSPEFAKNFLALGLEEIRDVPREHDIAALNYIGQHCVQYIFFCGNTKNPDQWCPKQHMAELEQAQAEGLLTDNIIMKCNEKLLHAFIVFPEMVGVVVDFICDSTSNAMNSYSSNAGSKLASKL